MEDYSILTLNTSRLGEGVVNGTLGKDQGTLGSLWNLVPDSIQNDIGEAAGVVTEKLGIEVRLASPPTTSYLQYSNMDVQ